MKIRLTLLALFVGLSILSCRAAQNINPVAAGPTPLPSLTPFPTETSTPSPTPTPPPTPTPLPAVRIQTGDHALFNGDWDAARAEYETARQVSQEADIQAAALLGLGRANLSAGDTAQALNAFESLIKTYPNSPQAPTAYLFLGKAYTSLDRFSEAADAYGNYLSKRPGLIDAYVLDLRGDALFATGDYTGAGAAFQDAIAAPSLLDSLYLQLKLARAVALSGDTDTALTLYDDVYLRTMNGHTRALVNLRKGQIYLQLGQTDSAYQVFLDSVNNYPTSYDSYSALLALVEAGVPVNELNRGIVDYYAGQHGVALAAIDRYLQTEPDDPATAYYYYGLSTQALGGHQGAMAEWDKIIENYPDHQFWDDAWEKKAYTQWAYLDQYTLAVETLLDFASTAPLHPRAAEFLFDAALVAEIGGKLEQATEIWSRVAIEYPESEQVHRALFLAGITYYRLENYTEALSAFQRALAFATALRDRSAAYLWIGKAQQAMGDEAAARTAWELTAGIDPTGYYSERALDILLDRKPFTPPGAFDLAADQTAERARAEEWIRQTFEIPPETNISDLGPLASDGYLIRGAELWQLGMYSEARSEFEQLRRTVQEDPVNSFRLAGYLVDLGLYRSATMTARQVLNLAGMDDATTMVAPMYFNRIRFGAHYADLLIPAAQEYGFHPLFLFSVVRQESLFESFATSSAAANGLMQIIPVTGESIARNLGWPPDYQTSDLYRPMVNVKFGVDYLDTQRSLFDGDMYAALAAYNGGPGNSLAWKRLAPDDPDLFLEVVRFSETRTYIRSIYEIFNIYRRLYDRTP